MSKLSFRARALDAAKPLPVYRNRDLPDLTDCVSISRAVPQMPTGMEKEEELEHHLQRAISAQQVFREKKENMVIPVPEAESNTTYYDRLYKGEVKVPKQLIHIQPLGLDLEQPDYDMDSEDETLLNRLNRKMEIKPLQFETMVDRLEKASTQQLVSVSEAKLLLNEDDYLLKSVYDYWLRKRKNWRGPTLIPHIKQEKRDGSTNNDAYVAFRRRTEKMQTRKNRKNDEASYEKMLRLRREFSRTVTILEMIKRREKSKRELLHLTLEVVERRYQMGDFSAEILREVTLPLVEKPLYSTPVTLNNRHKADVKMQKKPLSIRDELTSFDLIRPKKKSSRRDRLCPPQRRPGRPPGPYTVNKADIKQYDFHSSGEDDSPPPPLVSTSGSDYSPPSSADDEENNPDGLFVFRRKAGCQYLSPRVEQTGGVECERPEIVPLCLRHSLTELSLPPHWRGLSRRRVGRGGRIILDRASSGLDPLLKQLDTSTDPISRTRTSACLLSDPVLLDQKPSLTSGSSPPSLTEVLNNIQTLRRCCFRPRPAQDQRGGGSRTAGSRLTCRLSSHRSTAAAGGITEEQYHSHQQQLVQMQKEQLEQLQLQNNAALSRQTSQLDPHRTQSTRSSESTSKTLDSASAHFAASAVISAPPPHGHLNSENKPYKTSVNGVVHPTGPSRPPYSSTSLSRPGLSARGSSSLPAHSSSSPQSLPNQRSQVGAVSPAHPHSARPSAPPTSALKLATVAASLDRVPKVTTASSLPRDAHEPERLLNGLSETTLAMEVT
ncbi:enhancer of polycomb homolog 2 isoform X1 [Thunnus albacares]|uniref:enhancer of polycomb homolog 2 isoform X1 n=1 Tax=Thunnus maccoyii TaxID=8240 RepID=UPI001C4D77DE|nr:enhancer of polycomb homolog 2 isoform X1 [Thunnus maccoyii]XP_044221315.1 enhancer of polycomb homolog 2 isoform X1 [Thunnus albacares]